MTLSPAQLSLDPFDLFGRATRVIVDDSRAGQTLRRELSIYPAATGKVERTVRVTHDPVPLAGAVNPATHIHMDDGFVARYPNASVRFRFDGPRLAETILHLPAARSGMGAWRSRWRSIQYADSEQMSGQTLHELALVPALYFDDGGVPLHASGFALPDAGAILVGGTGGVGKTTIALDLCLTHGAAFGADDIAVLDESGSLHPNLAYPKIYAYNVQGDAALRDRVLGSAPLVERLQWDWRRRRAGAAKVRRRISPLDLYGSVMAQPTPVRRYLFLLREHRPSIAVREVSAQTAGEMSADVLRAEYDAWHRHLSWEAFNARAQGQAPRLNLDERFERFRAMAARALEDVDCRVVRVPLGLPHAEFRRELVTRIMAGG